MGRKKINMMNTTKHRSNSGIVYDEKKRRVLVAGGDRYENSEIEMFDVTKNLWILYENTQCVHYTKPVLWTSENEMLYMATCKGDVSYIDLRSNDKRWTIHSPDEFGIGSYRVIA